MKKPEMEKFKKLLLKKRDELMVDVNHITEDTRKNSQKEASGDLSAYSLHMADMASDNYDREFSLKLASGERNTLLDIDDALKRIKDESYGTCMSCGKKISKKRLTAVPHAKLCMACKRKEEAK
ncbi:MAG: TraR/DksA C4-type zinc finger protein [Candidatus Omnitrophica bacterium]|nr:TraR/DksA C4-type zinc finger protein [Candidatus Omnitrophota bacterium]MBU4487984.1 TraR/DksA C4-type zinc finger protein [Candidatus Omnitrophota bacterium]MCG2704773.1 TraR/DksA C4-type zinc finger protein [Candidatus Omnitrophota bacterium]